MNPYTTLGIPGTADLAAIRQAYRAKAKLYHPDVSTHPDAQEQFIRITQAYDLLCDPVKRARYDRLAKTPPAPAPAGRAQRQHEQDLRRGRARAEHRAAQYSRMSHTQFDQAFLSETVGYFAPKMLGCLGIFIAGLIVLFLIGMVIIRFELPGILIALPLFALFPAGAWFSTGFDAWHERRRKK